MHATTSMNLKIIMLTERSQNFGFLEYVAYDFICIQF